MHLGKSTEGIVNFSALFHIIWTQILVGRHRTQLGLWRNSSWKFIFMDHPTIFAFSVLYTIFVCICVLQNHHYLFLGLDCGVAWCYWSLFIGWKRPDIVYDSLSEELRYWKRKTGAVLTECQKPSRQKADVTQQSSTEVGLWHYLIVAFAVHN